MNNFINVRMTSHNNLKIFSNIQHNCRYRKSLSEVSKMKNKLIDIENASILTEYSNADEDKEISKYMYQTFSKKYHDDREEHHKLHKEHRHNRKVKPSFGSWGEMVFTFSESIDHDLHNKYSEEELIKIAHQCALELCKEMNTELRMMNIDFDEKRPHFQMFYKNFDEKGASVYYKHKNKEFMSRMQDIAFEHFGKLGMKRGISKETRALEDDSKKLAFDYKTTQQYYQEIEIKQRSVISGLSDIIDQLSNDVNNLKNLRNEISRSVDISAKEKKEIYSEITKVQKELRAMNKEKISQIKKIKSFNTEVDKDVDKILDYSKKIMSYDKDKLFKAIKSKLKQYASIDIKLDENNTLKQGNEALKAQIDILKDDLLKKDKKIEDLEEVNLEKTMYIKELKSKDKLNKSFTDHEVIQVTKKYESELNSLKSKNLDLEMKLDHEQKEHQKSKELIEYVHDNHKNIISEFEDQKKNQHFHRYR